MIDPAQIERIKSNAEQIKELWIRPPGAYPGHFKLNPPIARELLEDFESKSKVRMPEEYRCFILEIGNGGTIFEPFVPHQWLIEEVGKTCPMHPGLDHEEREELGKNYSCGEITQGCVPIAQTGCGDMDYLIVTGPGRGNMFNYAYECDPTFHSPFNGFLLWYESWQVYCLRRAGLLPAR